MRVIIEYQHEGKPFSTTFNTGEPQPLARVPMKNIQAAVEAAGWAEHKEYTRLLFGRDKPTLEPLGRAGARLA